MDEWNSINVETDRLLAEAEKIRAALDRTEARKAVLCGGLELKHDVAGSKLTIEDGVLIKRECDKGKEDRCALSG